MRETIAAREIGDALGKSAKSVQRIANKGGWSYKPNGQERQYYLEQLPAEIQERVFRYRNGIDEDSVEAMCRRMELKVPPEKIKDPAVATKIRMVCECLAVPEKARGRDARIGEIAEGHGFHKATAYRLIKKVKNGEPIFNGKKNYGVQAPLGITVRVWDEEAARMAIEELVANRRNHAEKLSLYKRIAERAEKQKLRVGSYRSFLDMAAKIDPALLKYRDAGMRGLREDIIPPIRRDHTAYRAMECLVGDQHKADYYCIDYNGDVATLELFCWLDFRTQMAWGAISYKHYNRYTVGQALLNAVRWGLPSIAYTDWGKPEESKYVSLLIEQLTGLGVRCDGIRHVRAKVRHPQAKPIEGWFGRLDRNLKNARIPGYSKRLKDSRENEAQQKELKELIRAGGLLRMDHLVARVFAVIDRWNSHLFKNRNIDSGKSPLQIYNEETAKHPVTTLSDDVLDYIFLPMQETTVRRSQVKIKHPIYKKTLTYYDAELANHNGTAVTVRYNPFNPESVWIFRDSKLICRAEEWRMINPKMRDEVAARIEAQNQLAKQIKERYEACLPEKKKRSHVPRIHPQEREARQVKATQALRVMRTPLDEEVDLETGEILAQGTGRGYRPLHFEKKKTVRLRPLMKLNWDRPHEEE